jgi:transposase-like protein
MSRKKRRTYDANFKLDTVMEGVRGEKSIAQICREKGIKDSLYYKWRDQFLARAPEIFEDQRSSQKAADEDRIAELERMVGKLALENELLKKARSWLGSQGR